jgi:hypothetical protein
MHIVRHELEPLALLPTSIPKHTQSTTHKSPDNVIDMNGRMRAQNETPNALYNDSDSAVSGLTTLDNDTDDFGQLIIQSARDQHRLREATRSNIPVQAFRKARTHPRVALTLENLERREQSPGEQNAQKWGSASAESSLSSQRSNPPLRPPREWGRKGKRRNDWLRKVMEPGDIEKTPKAIRSGQTETSGSQGSSVSAPDADVPVESIEVSPPKLLSTQRSSPVGGYNESLARAHEWELTEDMSLGSIIASTPAAPRNTVLDEIRLREIENLRERKVTSSRLEEIRETTEEQSLAQRAQAETSKRPEIDPSIMKTSPNHTDSISRVSTTVKEPEKHPHNGVSPNLRVDRGVETSLNSREELHAGEQLTRPPRRRDDSQDLLRRLARVTSSSPSPARTTESYSQLRSSPIVKDGANHPTHLENRDRKASKPATFQTSDIQNRELLAEQMNDSEKENIAPQDPLSTKTEQSKAPIDNTKLGNVCPEETLPVKTPRVIGAWVDTPITQRTMLATNASQEDSSAQVGTAQVGTAHRNAKLEDLEDVELTRDATRSNNHESPTTENASQSKPGLAPSALASLVDHAREKRKNGLDDVFGDSTIDSLEHLIHPDDELTASVTMDEDTLQGLKVPPNLPKTEAERVRYREAIALHRMNERLRATRTNIRDTQRGLKKIETRVDKADRVVVPGNLNITTKTCSACGCPSGGVIFSGGPILRALCDGLTNLFMSRDGSGRIILTWLGALCLLLCLWMFTEISLW